MNRSAAAPILRPRHRPEIRARSGSRVGRSPLAPTATAHLPTPERPAEVPGPEVDMAPEKSRLWIAQYIYPGPKGETRLVVRKIRARDRQSAEAVAVKGAPAREFALTLLPESDDQFLGQVRHRALAAKARQS